MKNDTTILGRIYVAEMIIIIYDDDNDDSGMVIMDEKQHNGSFDKIKSFPIYLIGSDFGNGNKKKHWKRIGKKLILFFCWKPQNCSICDIRYYGTIDTIDDCVCVPYSRSYFDVL
ncbi:hypothetical protein DERF_013069 [Dermatophagoides farinae]|uniref:Uncharacterized protein n=1 Tax=Dermatophagoides farinae TaxID=6954 RepID=A0A922HNX6_DERFA|nr:hypothetical protein DERF_013069 [Dermatophagoides farinae]